MVNAWSLLYEELNGTMDEVYPIMSGINTALSDKSEYYFDYDRNDPDRVSPFQYFDDEGNVDSLMDTLNIGTPIAGKPSNDTITFTGMSSSIGAADTITFGGSHLPGGMGEDHISFNTNYRSPSITSDTVDDVNAYHYPGTDIKPQPDLKYKSQKYQEDKGIADLKDYVSSTYRGHYTNDNSDTQTLDLIHSVGDAESFCRSNAIKYLSRYDKKGQAKRDILKAMHYCLLLYYFSGQTNETPTRGYETF